VVSSLLGRKKQISKEQTMARNLKVLVAAAVATLSLGAFWTALAQATHLNITSPKAEWTLTGEAIGSHVFGAGVVGARRFSCTSTTLVDTFTHWGANPTAELVPTYLGCSTQPGASPVTFDRQGCTYTITPTSEKLEGSPATKAKATTTLDCPAGKEIFVDIYENATRHAENKPLCVYGIPPFTATVELDNITTATPEHVVLTVKIEKIVFNVKTGSKLICGAEAGSSTTYSYQNVTGSAAEFTIKAHSPVGIPVGVMIG
jgi:hypothetical protein